MEPIAEQIERVYADVGNGVPIDGHQATSDAAATFRFALLQERTTSSLSLARALLLSKLSDDFKHIREARIYRDEAAIFSFKSAHILLTSTVTSEQSSI
jgi:hypothetical protein